MKTEVTRDIREKSGWMVWVNGNPTTPTFNSKGAAQAYADQLQGGKRKPEFSLQSKWKPSKSH